MTPEVGVVVVAIGQAVVWLAITLVARNMLQIWVRFKEDQRAIERAREVLGQERQVHNDVHRLGVVQPVPRGTPGAAPEAREYLRGNRNRLSELSRPGDVVIPDDLEAHCAQWEDSWARDDERTNVRHKFVELFTGDAKETWQLVRRAVGIGEMP